jgi:hypothetical protein
MSDPTSGMTGSEAAAYHEEFGEGVSEDDVETQLDPHVPDAPEVEAGVPLLPPNSP